MMKRLERIVRRILSLVWPDLRHDLKEAAARFGPLFDAEWYRTNNPDLAASGVEPLLHYLREGARQGRDPNPLFHAAWYLARNPDVAAGVLLPLDHYIRFGAAEGRDPSAVFSGGWYLDSHPDVRASGLNPLAHYLAFGAHEGRDPSPLFDAAWYLERNTDIAASGANPLVHYVERGATEGRDPSPLFWTGWYLEKNPDVRAGGLNPLAHYLEAGGQEGRDPCPVFDGRFYLANGPDVRDGGEHPLLHYLKSGAGEGRDPSPYFHTAWYLDRYPDIRESGVNPLVHYLKRGGVEGRDPSPLFDGAWYLRTNPDVAALGENPLRHYLKSGYLEGRDPSPLFDVRWYLNRYPDVAENGVEPLGHFLVSGASDRRDPCPLFETVWYLHENADVARAGVNPLAHYRLVGGFEGRDPSPVFDSDWYLASHPSVARARLNPLAHYLRQGAKEGLSPHPLFDATRYRAQAPSVAESTQDPLIHYLTMGAAQGLDPCALFSTNWYVSNNPDVAATGENPLRHYLARGAREDRDPSPLFDTRWYRERGPDLDTGQSPLADYVLRGAAAGRDPHPLFQTAWYREQVPQLGPAVVPLAHYVDRGGFEGLDPHPLFDSDWYLASTGLAEAGINPLFHYLAYGASEGWNPSPSFDGRWYLAANPDVAAAGWNPLTHYVVAGESEGRAPNDVPARPVARERLAQRYDDVGDLGAVTLTRMDGSALAPVSGRFLPNRPINAFLDHRLNATPRLRIMLPSVQYRHATGGPNTAFLLGSLLARAGFPVTFTGTDTAPDEDLGPIKEHLRSLAAIDPDAVDIRFENASDRETAWGVGYNDALLATAWWTAHMAHPVAQFLRRKRIYYLVQDYETLFYGASENYADAEASYRFDHFPIINTALLRDHLVQNGVGRYADPDFARRALSFEPAVDRSYFFPEPRPSSGRRKLIFYARPTVAPRNLFGLGVAALRGAVQAGLFGEGEWEFVGMGEPFDPVPLGRGYDLVPAPWLGFEAYAAQMRSADLLLSLMLSPHPSYPPLEMAACGGLAVTTAFGSKTKQRLAALSPNLIGADATIADLLLGLSKAVARLGEGVPSASSAGTMASPETWPASLSGVVDALGAELRRDGVLPREEAMALPSLRSSVLCDSESEDGPEPYSKALADRRTRYRPASSGGLVSLLTTVYDTDPSYLADLAHTVFGQEEAGEFEWILLDNGSTDPGTLSVLEKLGAHPSVRLGRVEANLGIVGGMRWCLKRARHRYVMPVDSDDLLFPDCLRTVASFIEQTGFPTILYTDEDKIEGEHHHSAYAKPDWDPVLFVHSCYIAHLTAIDRATALALGCYGDVRAEGCHDWDTFTRFLLAGHRPEHLPEILYSWRVHPSSTSGNFRSKPYVFDSHRAVLDKFLDARGGPGRFEITPAPLFDGTPDYRFRPRDPTAPALSRIDLAGEVSRGQLIAVLATIPPEVRYVHLLDPRCSPVGDLALEEMETLVALFPDTVMAGGRIHDGRTIGEAGYVLGDECPIHCPDRGREVDDPGYFAQMWKPHGVAAVSARHAFVTRGFLEEAVGRLPETLSLAALGPWLGALGRAAGGRVVYSPYIEALSDEVLAMSGIERQRFRLAFEGALVFPTSGALADGRGREGWPAVPEPTRHPTYAELCAAEEEEGGEIPPGGPGISVITTVYERTDTALFRETAASVAGQSLRPLEWLVLAHGPIARDLETTLSALAEAGTLRLLRLDRNLGICGGMRHCLEHARGKFVTALDGDDLLSRHAIATMTRALRESPASRIFYSDEDHLVDGRRASPYRRPDFDPALVFAHSYVWHSIWFEREKALESGAFTAASAEFAQDWDLLLRFATAGDIPVHVARVLYHWRQHASSLSNSGTTFAGSMNSVQAMLETVRSGLPRRDDLEVVPYRLAGRVPDYRLRRRHARPGSVATLRLLGRDERDGEPVLPFPFVEAASVAAGRGPGGAAALRSTVAQLASDLVLVTGPGVMEVGEDGIWEALKHVEMLPSCAAVTGTLLRRDGTILNGPMVLRDARTLVDPLAGHPLVEPGPFSLGLKPHCVSAAIVDLLLVRRSFLLDVLDERPPDCGLRSLGAWLGARAEAAGQVVVYEPMLRAFVDRQDAAIGDPVEGLTTAVRAIVEPHLRSSRTRPLRGLAGFARRPTSA